MHQMAQVRSHRSAPPMKMSMTTSAAALALLLSLSVCASGCVKPVTAPAANGMGQPAAEEPMATAAPAPKKDEPEGPVVPRKRARTSSWARSGGSIPTRMHRWR